MKLEPTIGLEVHAELKTRTKMFCDSPNDPDEPRPNANVCPVCMGHPGTLPAVNRDAVRKIIQVGLALGGDIATQTHFDRKNYFYPDLPKGYQISQYQHPLVKGGYLDIPASANEWADESKKQKVESKNTNQNVNRVRIQRVHLEEDTGRLIHDSKTKTTLIDFNRAGVPLLELVTEPDLQSAEETRRFAESLQLILQHLGASDANMEKGEMRIEANVSLRPAGSDGLGTKVELKNINSFRFVEQAIAHEIDRQSELLNRGERILQETRGWDEARGITVAQRSKEEAHDYRYFPEPDLPPLSIEPSLVEELRASLPELPHAKLLRFQKEYGIDPALARTIVRDKRLAAYFEETVSELKEWLAAEGRDAGDPQPMRLAANYLTTDLSKLVAESGAPISKILITPENFAELIACLVGEKISSRAAKEVLREMFRSGADPSQIIEERGLWQVSATEALAEAAAKIIEANPKAAADYRAGKAAALQFLVGQVMKDAAGANPDGVRKLLEEKLK